MHSFFVHFEHQIGTPVAKVGGTKAPAKHSRYVRNNRKWRIRSTFNQPKHQPMNIYSVDKHLRTCSQTCSAFPLRYFPRYNFERVAVTCGPWLSSLLNCVPSASSRLRPVDFHSLQSCHFKKPKAHTANFRTSIITHKQVLNHTVRRMILEYPYR